MSKSEATEAAPKKGKKPLIMMIGAVLLLLGGVAGGYFAFGAKDKPEPPPEPGVVVKLEPITVNLADGHFLKVGIALQATADAAEEPDGAKALDLLISEFSNKEVAELSTNGAREEAKKHLKEKIIEAYVKDEKKQEMDIYMTEIVM